MIGRIKKIIFTLVLFICMLSMTGCKTEVKKETNTKKSVFEINSKDEKTVVLKIENSKKDSSDSAKIIISEGESLSIEPNLKDKSKINMRLIQAIGKDTTNCLIDEDIYGSNPYVYTVEPGEYEIYFTAVESVTGTINVNVR